MLHARVSDAKSSTDVEEGFKKARGLSDETNQNEAKKADRELQFCGMTFTRPDWAIYLDNIPNLRTPTGLKWLLWNSGKLILFVVLPWVLIISGASYVWSMLLLTMGFFSEEVEMCQLQALTRLLNVFKEQNIVLNKNNEAYRTQIGQQQQINADMILTTTKLEQELDSIQTENVEFRTNNANLERELGAIKTENTEFRANNANLERELGAIQGENSKFRTNNANLKTTVDLLRQSQMQAAQDRISLIGATEEIQEMMKAKLDSFADDEEEFRKFLVPMESTVQNLRQTQKALEENEGKLVRLTTKLENTELRLNRTMVEMETLSRKNLQEVKQRMAEEDRRKKLREEEERAMRKLLQTMQTHQQLVQFKAAAILLKEEYGGRWEGVPVTAYKQLMMRKLEITDDAAGDPPLRPDDCEKRSSPTASVSAMGNADHMSMGTEGSLAATILSWTADIKKKRELSY